MSLVHGVMTAADSMKPVELVSHARRLESLGYASMWVTDVFGREVYVTAGHLLAHTETIKVATGIAHIYGRDAIATVQAARTLWSSPAAVSCRDSACRTRWPRRCAASRGRTPSTRRVRI